MKNSSIIAAAMLIAHASAAFAGETELKSQPAQQPAKSIIEKETSELDWPAGSITLGGLFSEHATGGYIDALTGLWTSSDRNSFLFLDARYHYEDNDQSIFSTGLGFRQMILDGKAIVGGNVFWDALHSAEDNDFSQLGLGVEVMTKWVDFHFNYYLPEDKRFEFGRSSSTSTSTVFSPVGIRETSETTNFRRYEAGLEGFNTEVGFLVPWLDRYADVRVFGGYYHYDNPFGGDFDGFTGRVEARVLQGVTLDVEYWDDAALNGGHWTGGVRVSLPFTMANVFTGKNPFEGAADMFKPCHRELKDRMGEMLHRSHRIQTVTSGNVPVGTMQEVRFTPIERQDSGAAAPRNFAPAGSGGFPIE